MTEEQRNANELKKYKVHEAIRNLVYHATLLGEMTEIVKLGYASFGSKAQEISKIVDKNREDLFNYVCEIINE